MEWDPRIGAYVDVDNMQQARYLQELNRQIEEVVNDTYMNYMIKECEKNEIIQLNNMIKEYEDNYVNEFTYFESLALVPNTILLKLKDIIKYRKDYYPSSLFENLRKYDRYRRYLLNIANIMHHISITNNA